MRLLSNIQFTLNSIFELYKDQGKRYYNFSMLFTIFSLLFCTLFVALLLAAYYLCAAAISGESVDFSRILEQTDIALDVSIYSEFMVVLTIALFGIFLHRQANAKEKITFSIFFRSIPADTWLYYFLFTVVGIAFSKYATTLLTYERQSSWASPEQLIASYGFTGSPLLDWFVSLGKLVLAFLPVILVFFLLRRYLAKHGTVLGKQDARTAFFALLTVGFCVNTLSMQVIWFVRDYVFKLLYMPFEEWLIPAVLGIAVYVFLIAVFYPALAGSALYPFLHRSEKELVDENLIDETP